MPATLLTILPQLKLIAQGITVANHYSTTVKYVDYEFKTPEQLAVTQFPAIIIVPNLVSYLDTSDNHTDAIFRAYLFGYLNTSTNITTALLTLAADVYKAISNNNRVNDTADYINILTVELSSGVFEPFGIIAQLKNPYAAFRMDLETQYQANKLTGG